MVSLPEDDATTFRSYVQWLYTRRIVYYEEWYYMAFAKMYTLGEKLLDRDFQDRVLDAIVAEVRELKQNASGHVVREMPVKSAVDVIYQGTPAGSPGRRLMVGLHLRHGNKGFLDRERPEENKP